MLAPEVSLCLNAGGMGRQDGESETFISVAHALRGEGFDASEDGTGRGTPLVPVAFHANAQAAQLPGIGRDTTVSDALTCSQNAAVAFDAYNQSLDASGATPTMSGCTHHNRTPQALVGPAVRRLTPTECERLQGFPDGYTLVPYRGKPAADGPRYKALGNSMAVNCMAWIGWRIQMAGAIQAVEYEPEAMA